MRHGKGHPEGVCPVEWLPQVRSWSAEPNEFFLCDSGAGRRTADLEEPRHRASSPSRARARIALTVTDADSGQHQDQHGDDLGVHGVGGRARRRLQGWTARGHRGGPRVKVRQRETRAGRFRSERLAGRGGARQGAGLECGWGL